MFYIFLLQTWDLVYETPSQHSLQFEVSQLMKDNEISRYADPSRVLQKTMEKQNEEPIILTLTVPQTEEIEKRIQLLLQQRKQLEVSSQIIM